MGSLILGVAGAALGTFLGGPLGGAIGGALGSAAGRVVDNLLFAPGGTKTEVQGPRLNDLSVMSSAYGQVIPLCYGPNNRLAVNIIWSSGLIEDQHTETQRAGGKGKGGGKGATSEQTQTTYTYRVHFAAAICEGNPNIVLKRIFANKKVIYDAGAFSKMRTVNFYPGNGTQTPDFTLEAFLGVGNAPAYRHTCYMVITDLQLADFGNSIPSIEVEIAAHPSVTVGNVVLDLCQRSGIDTASVAGLSDLVKGYTITSSVNAVGACQPLALAYNFDASEGRGDIRFTKRGQSMKGVIEQGDMGCVVSGEDTAEPINFERNADVSLPNEVAVSYSDIGFDYQVSTQRERRTLGSSDNNLSSELAVVLSATEAAAIATRLMYEAWAARTVAGFNYSEKWGQLAPSDVFGIVIKDNVIPYKLTRFTRGANGVYEVEARYEDLEVYSSLAPGQEAILPINIYVPPGETKLVLIDGPMFLSVNDDAGFYYATGSASNGWRGAAISRSVDGGTSYMPMVTFIARSLTGTVAAALPTGPTAFFDEGNTVTVVLDYAQHVLESATELEVLSGANAFWLGNGATGQGGEIIQFKTATLVAPQTYQLGGLMRGRRGTEYAVGTHAINETFCFLSTGTIGRVNFTTADWNLARLYKGTTIYNDELLTTPQSFTNTGEAKRPFAPVHVAGERDGSNNLTITWVRRTRFYAAPFGIAPLGETSENYEVDVYLGGTIVRTISTATPTVVYTAVQMVADGITPGVPVHVKVYQISDVRGRGHEADATI
jgi:hypothetical protein